MDKDEVARRFGEVVRSRRQARGQTVIAFSTAMEWNRQRLHRVETGRALVNMHELVTLAQVLRVSPLTLLREALQ